jgi:predicted ATPase/transcriptional regulator with XRE-family HTH domain
LRDTPSFGQWLGQRRKAFGLTQEELAERLACSASLIRKLELGQRVASQAMADLLAELLGVAPEERAAFVQFANGRLSGDAVQRKLWRTLHSHTAQAHPTNLPAPLTVLIGREQDLNSLREHLLVPNGRLVTITGPPGIGKTRLALEAGISLLDHFDDGVFFASLAPINDPGKVPPAIARDLGIKDMGNLPTAEQLVRFLREKRLLLVLDNFEQVLDASPVVVDLLAACPGLKVIVTSREALHVLGEQQFQVPALGTVDPAMLPPIEILRSVPAVTLFVERARAVKPAFALTQENAHTVATICARLQGLPLAIELASARVNLLSAQEIQLRLDDSLALLESAARHLPSRQRTLRGAIDWSYALLSEEEKTLFARLGVFVGGCTLAAVEAVCGEARGMSDSGGRRGVGLTEELTPDRPPLSHSSFVLMPLAPVEIDVLSGLASLVDKSLSQREEDTQGESRFTILETILEYARTKIAARGEVEELRRRHALFFAALAEQAYAHASDQEQSRWLERLDRDQDNLLAALRWANKQQRSEDAQIGVQLAGALTHFWRRRGYLTEGRAQLKAALSRTGDGTAASNGSGKEIDLDALRTQSSFRARALLGAGTLAYGQGDYTAAAPLYREALEIYRELADKVGIGRAINNLGLVAMAGGDAASGRSLFEEALAIDRELGDKVGLSRSLINVAWAAQTQGDYETAQSLLEECLAVDRELGHRQGVALTFGNLGNIAKNKGDLAHAGSLFEASREIYQELGDRAGVASESGSLAFVALSQGDNEAATSLGRHSLVLLREIGQKALVPYMLILLGSVAASQGGVQRATRLWGAAEALFEAMGMPSVPEDLADHEQNVAAARAQVDPSTWEQEWSRGRAMSMEEASEYALEDAPLER